MKLRILHPTVFAFVILFSITARGQLSHPRVMFTSSEISSIRTKLNGTGFSHTLYQKLKARADAYVSNLPGGFWKLGSNGKTCDWWGYQLAPEEYIPLAFIVEQDNSYKNAAFAYADSLADSTTGANLWQHCWTDQDGSHTDASDFTYCPLAEALASIFDITYSDLSSSQRSRYADALYRLLRIFSCRTLKPNYCVTPNYWCGDQQDLSSAYDGNNHAFKHLCAWGLVAVALDGETVHEDDGTAVIYHASDDLDFLYDRITFLMEQILGDGGCIEGYGYSYHSFSAVTELAVALNNWDAQKGISSHNLLEYRPSWDNTYRILERAYKWLTSEASNAQRSHYSPDLDLGFDVNGYNVILGVDQPWFLPVLMDYYNDPSGLWAFSKMTDYTLLGCHGDQTGIAAYAAIKYDDTWGTPGSASSPSSPFSYLAPVRGTYYYRDGFDINDLQWALDWRPSINPFTDNHNWRHATFERGSFVINYGGIGFCSIGSGAWLEANVFHAAPTDGSNNLLIKRFDPASNTYRFRGPNCQVNLSGSGIGLPAWDSYVDASLRSNAFSSTSDILNIDLVNSFNELIHPKSNPIGGYDLYTQQNPSPDWPADSFKTIQSYEKFFFNRRSEGNVPAYFLSTDFANLNGNTTDYKLQFFSDSRGTSFPTPLNSDITISGTSPYSIVSTSYQMNIYNLCNSNSLYFKAESTPIGWGSRMIPVKRLSITERNVVESSLPLLWIPYEKSSAHLPQLTKSTSTGANWGSLDWSSDGVLDYYWLSDYIWYSQYFNSISGINAAGIEARIRFGNIRTNTSNNNVESYALSQGKTLHYKRPNDNPFTFPTFVNPYRVVGTFENYNSSVSFDGAKVDFSSRKDDGSLNTSPEFLFYAPRPATGPDIVLSINGSSAQYSRPATTNDMKNYISKSDPLWDFSCPQYGTWGTHSLAADMNNDGITDLVMFTDWGTLLIDYGPMYGAWDYSHDYGSPESPNLKFFVGKFGPATYRGIGIVSSGRLKVSYCSATGTFNGWDINYPIEDSDLMTVAVGKFDPTSAYEDFAIKQAWGPVKVYLYSNGAWVTPSATYHYTWGGHPGEDLPGYLYGGDFDGDGKGDLGIYSVNVDVDPNIGYVMLDYQSNGFATSNTGDLWFGTGLDWMTVNYKNITVAKYDNDAKADFGIIGLPSAGPTLANWNVYKSSDATPYGTPHLWVSNFYDLTGTDAPIPGVFESGGSIKPGLKTNSDPGCFKISYKTPAPKIAIGLREQNLKYGVDVEPNPFGTSTQIHLTAPLNSVITIQVVDMLGRVIISKELTSTSATENIPIDASSLPIGLYPYSVRINNELHSGILSVIR
jgi:hypothetical protein